MALIYSGIKAGADSYNISAINKELDSMVCQGAETFILGCTELPIIADTLPQPGPFVDPTAELAKAAIRFCGYGVKGE